MNFFIAFRRYFLMIGVLTLTVPMQMWGGSQGWVSGTGTDAGSCPIDSPCATFQRAFENLFGGSPIVQVIAIDSGSYQGLQIDPPSSNIAKAYTIDGGEGNSSCLMGQNIIVGSGGHVFGTGTIVLIRNLTMYGEGLNGPAIKLGEYSNGLTLIIENCKIYDYSPSPGTGVIDCQNPANLIIKNTIIEASNGDAIVVNSPGGAFFSFNELAIKQNSGIALNISGNGAFVDISDSIITQNGGSAILASGSNVSVNCLNNVLTSNGFTNTQAVIGVGNSALVRISNNDIYNNYGFIDYVDSTGQVITANDNRTGSNGGISTNPTGSIQIQ